jgi:hypothetical protein
LILGFSNFWLENANGVLSDEQKNDLAIIEKMARKILSVLNETLGLVYLDSHIFGFRKEPLLQEVDLEQVINDIVSRFQHNDFQVELHISEPLPKVWAAYSGVDYIFSGVAWTLSNYEERKLVISANYDDNWVTIKIENPIFTLTESALEKFNDSEPILTLMSQDYLRNCRYLVEIQGGQMHLASQEKGGTEVTFTLPIYKTVSSAI